ncbi:MAG: 16S rRNA (cytosine(967)-C(5))-methyltransferase RsmB [Acidimicrobiia bacterium]|nr:MAG: 16S rRNA (cytosine(967)-C(5))-methyltransferase RsmB [Acidimicrobiia bacterium]
MTTDDLSTRARAARTLDRVTDHGAYSNIVVANDRALGSGDHALYQRLVFEALRYLPAIDETIERAASRETDRIQPEVLAVLRIATGELRYLRRSPHSAVSEAVDAIRQLGRPKAAGFVNGVLRSVVRQLDEAVPSDSTLGMPAWLYDRLTSIFQEKTREFVDGSNAPARTGFRSNDGVIRGASSGVSGASYATEDTDVSSLVSSGLIEVIDPASVAVVNALEVSVGDRVADLAAAPGGKTRIIADLVGETGSVVACDNHYRRLATAKRRLADSGKVDWVLADAGRPALRTRSFDRVLLDAPCTGLGTLRRRPEIRYRIGEDAPRRYGEFQRRMLQKALSLVKEGGRLVYSVCTVFPEETIDVVDGLGGYRPDDVPGLAWGDGVLLAPHITQTDGMFITTFDR